MNIDLPKCRDSYLAYSFNNVLFPVVSNIKRSPLVLLGIDDDKNDYVIFPKVYTYSDIQSIDSSEVSVEIKDWTCNDLEYTVFDFSRFTEVESIKIGDDCFASVNTFRIDGLNRLKTLRIGKNSFSQARNNEWLERMDITLIRANDRSKSFRILNCESLESIEIDRYSFSDFGGDFELRNLPQLHNVQIGQTEYQSYNFFYSSLVIRGIGLILNN